MPQATRGSTPFPMQYQVLARKWRPQNFSDLVGQEHVSRTLLNALQSGRVAHAFLFSGPRGSGKTTTARLLAKALNCHEGAPGEPCSRCVACAEIAAGNCMDVLEIDAASNTGVDNVRNLIEELQYRPARDRNKIYIIDEIHMLSNSAFNALLKTLEEPPPHVVFIMATTEYHKIPATILSRCQQHSFKLIPYPLIEERLRFIADAEEFQISKRSLEQIVYSSGGSMRDAMSALDQVIAFSGKTVRDEDVAMLLGLVEPAVLGETVKAIAGNDAETLLKIVGRLVETGQDLQNFARRLLARFRDLMVVKSGAGEAAILGVPESLVPELEEQAGLFSREDLLRMFDALIGIEAGLKNATQLRFHLEMGLIEIAHLSRLRALEDLVEDFRQLVRGGAAPVSPAPPASRPAAPPADQPSPEPAVQPNARRFLLDIAAAVKKESLAPVLHSFLGARLEEDVVTIELEQDNDFVRRQIKDNLALITAAASQVAGRTVRVRFIAHSGSGPAKPPKNAGPASSAPSGDELLERAKQDPAVRSFLELFPGPVKAEKID